MDSSAPASPASRKIIPIVPAGSDSTGLYEATKKIYPRSVRGMFARWRWAMVFLTQLVFYGIPWAQWGERQLVLFDLAARRFYIFGMVLYPQDLIYLSGLLVVSALALFLFTAVAGRLWCGFACPQTVYTEIFMWVEHKIEGNRTARMRLDAGSMSLEKLVKKWFKHLVWIGIALWTGFTFVGYFTPIRELGMAFLQARMGSWEVFWVFFYGFATYGNAGFMREQVCKYMCPYARFQSAMFDRDTLIVTYDPKRGEPRAPRRKGVDPRSMALGDCIDCGLCVQVCPTGIDIRQGLQYECIGCGLCVDACDTVMQKMSYAPRLIRYDTQNGMEAGWSRRQLVRRVLRPRVLVYTAVLALLVTGLLASLVTRTPLKVDVVRDRASLARIVEGGRLENVYRLQIMNATEDPRHYRIAAHGIEGLSVSPDDRVTVGPASRAGSPCGCRCPTVRLRPVRTRCISTSGKRPTGFRYRKKRFSWCRAEGNEMNTTKNELPAPEDRWWRHPLLWMVIAGPALVVVASFVTFWYAWQSPDSLVAEDYYRRGVEINKTLADKKLMPALAGRNHAATPAEAVPPPRREAAP